MWTLAVNDLKCLQQNWGAAERKLGGLGPPWPQPRTAPGYYYMATHTDIGREEDQKTMDWLDNIREDCEDMNMSILQASRLRWDRTKWRNTVHNLGLPEREDNVIVAKAISQVK